MATTSVKYWSSSPRQVTPAGVVAPQEHVVLLSVCQANQPEKTIRIATCLSGAVSARIALALDKYEKDLGG